MYKKTIAVCTLSIGDIYKERTKNSRLNKINYCNKHNYRLIEDESIYDTSKPIPWSKIKLILKYLPEYDYIIWIDADMLIMNSNTTLESLIEKYKDYNIICGSDWRMPNTGFLIVKNTQFSYDFWNAVWDNIYDPYEDPDERYLNWEQGSFINLYDRNYLNSKEFIKVTEPTEMNSYWYNFFPNHFILHFPAVRGDLLGYLLRDFCPDKMDIDTEESYKSRLEWLSGEVRIFLEKKLQHERSNDNDLSSSILDIDIISEADYTTLLENNKKHLDNLLNIVKYSKEELELNYMYSQNTFELNLTQLSKQRNLFSIASKSSNKFVLEIGFNCGHSTFIMLLSNPNLVIHCFDICFHTYTKPAFEYLQNIFPDRLFLHEGNSLETIPEFTKTNPNIKFDLIHIDSCYNPHEVNCDFFNTLVLSKRPSGIVILNNIHIPSLQNLWDGYIKNGHITSITNMLPIESYAHAIGIYK